MANIKTTIIDFFNTLSVYDYVGFAITMFLFFLFLILALILRRRTKLSLLFVLTGFSFFFIGPGLTHMLVKKTVFQSSVELSEVKQLYYSDTLLIKGLLSYKGTKNANHCEVEAKIHKRSSSAVKDFTYSLKSYRSGSQKIDKTFTKGDSVDFKIVIEPFSYKGDYNITLNSGCFR